jgi:hypothetical protein
MKKTIWGAFGWLNLEPLLIEIQHQSLRVNPLPSTIGHSLPNRLGLHSQDWFKKKTEEKHRKT